VKKHTQNNRNNYRRWTPNLELIKNLNFVDFQVLLVKKNETEEMKMKQYQLMTTQKDDSTDSEIFFRNYKEDRRPRSSGNSI
jgi:hypothetical protein